MIRLDRQGRQKIAVPGIQAAGAVINFSQKKIGGGVTPPLRCGPRDFITQHHNSARVNFGFDQLKRG